MNQHSSFYLHGCLLGMILMLSSCVPVVVAGGAAAMGRSVSSDGRSLQTMTDDTTAASVASRQLFLDADLRQSSRVHAIVFNRTLLLTGEVLSQDLKIKAEKLVQSIENVDRVYNKIEVSSIKGGFDVTKDAMITARIKARLLGAPDIDSSQFKIHTENQVAYLMAVGSEETIKQALTIVRRTPGVNKVVTLVTVTSSKHVSDH